MSRINQGFDSDNNKETISAGTESNDTASSRQHTSAPPRPEGEVNGRKRVERRRNQRIALWVISGITTIISIAGTTALCDITMIPSWLPWLLGAAVGIATGLHCAGWWQSFTGLRWRWVNVAIHTVVVGSIIAFAFILANRLGASDEVEILDAGVERVYRKERHHSRRVGRHRYVRGEAYYVYYIDVDVDGHHQTLPINRNQYTSLRRADTITIPARRGLFGYRILDQTGIK